MDILSKNIIAGTIFAALGLAVSPAQASVTSGVAISSFAGATVEKFNNGPTQYVSSYDFGNGLSYQNNSTQTDIVNYNGGYGMGNATSISTGKDGDGYFGTYDTPSTFRFYFSGGATSFGFFGAESDVNEIGGRDALLTLNFYGNSNNLLGTIDESTPTSVFAWDQFHGFSSTSTIYSVEFVGAGHMVIDNLHFVASVPEPETYAMLLAGLGLMGGIARRRKQK